MNLKETIQLIQETAVKAAEPTRISEAGSEVLYLVNGQIVNVRLDYPPRSHQVERLDDFLAATERWATQIDEFGTIWHNEDAVILVTDDERREDTVTLALRKSEQWAAIAKLPQRFDQRSIVRFLRHTLDGCGVEDLIPVFRTLTFDRSHRGNADVQHGDESLGRSVEQKVAGADKIPEGFTASIPVYENVGLQRRYPVRLSVEIDVPNETFGLAPFPGEIAGLMNAVQQEIHETLSDGAPNGVSVFWGHPGLDG